MPFLRRRTELSAEDIGVVAEKGLAAARLSGEKKRALLDRGLDEVYAVRAMRNAPIPGLEAAEVDCLTARFFPAPRVEAAPGSSLWIKIKEAALELVGPVTEWRVGSAAFACRGNATKTIALHKEIGRMTVHMEVIGRPDRLADFRLQLSDESRRDKASFEVELYRNDKCVEAMSGALGETITLSRIETGEYRLRLTDRKGEIASLAIRME